MKYVLIFATVFLAVEPCFAGSTKTVNLPCDKAVTQAQVFAAKRKWYSNRSDPTAPTLDISTSQNFAKAVLLGSVFSHPKHGSLIFEDADTGCKVTSNGHPADVVLSDLTKIKPAIEAETIASAPK